MSSIHSGQYVTVVNLTAEATMPVNTAFCQSFYENPLFLSQDAVPPDDQQLTKSPSNEFVTVLDVSDDSIELESTANTDRKLEGRGEKRPSSDGGSTRPQTESKSGEEVVVYRLTGELLGLGLKFVGGEAGTQPVDQVIIRCCADDSPASRATSSWGGLKEGDRIICICGIPVTQLTRTECVRLLRDTPLQVALVMQRAIDKRGTLISQDSGIALGDDFTELESDGIAQMGSGGVLSSKSAHEGERFAASEDQGANGIWAETLGHFEILEREFGLNTSLDALKPLAPPALFQDADCFPDQLADDPLASTPEPTATDSDEGFHDTYMTPSGISNNTSGRSPSSPSNRGREGCMVAPDIQHFDSSSVGVIHENLLEAPTSPQFKKSCLQPSNNRKAADARSITKESFETSHQSDGVVLGGAENKSTAALSTDHRRQSSGDDVSTQASILIQESRFGETEGSSAQANAATCNLERHPKPTPRRRSKTTTDSVRTAASTTYPLHTSTVSPLDTPTLSSLQTSTEFLLHPSSTGFPLRTSTISPLHTSTVSPLHTPSTVSPQHTSTISPLHTSTFSLLQTSSTVSPQHTSTISPLHTSTVSPLHTPSTASPLNTSTASLLHPASTVSSLLPASTVSLLLPASTVSPVNSISCNDVSMVSVQSSWLLDATDPSRSMGKRSWQSSSGESSPPSFPRLPPDGHEFPPQFDDLPLIRPPGDFLDECGFKETKLKSANRPIRDVRVSSSDISGLREQMKKEISITSTSKPQSRSTRGRVSVRDKIALFSSQSVEHLAPKHERLNKQNSINGDYSGNHFTHSSQERSKSDLKLEKVDRTSDSWTGVSKRKNSDPCGAKYGSLTDVFPGNGKRVLSRETVTAQRTECFHMSRNSVDRASDETDCVPQLSERSQSLVQLNNSEKTHSPSGVPWRAPSFNPSTSLSRKVSLNAISEERRKNISKLRGLVIPNKVEGLTKKGPTDLPTIKSKSPTSHTASGFRRTPKQLSPTTPPKEIANNKKATEITHLSTLPWKGDTPTFPKYSPAFKRKNISLCVSSSSLNFSPPGLSSPAARLGGSNLELSDHGHIASSNRFSRALHKEMELMREPLQRSSSLNSRPLATNVKVCRNISDETLLPESNQSLFSPEDVTSSTLTLVNEPLSDVAEVATNRSRSGSVDQDIAPHSSLLHNGLNIGADLRASSSTLHGSPIKEIDIDSTNSDSENPLGDRQGSQMGDIIVPVPVDISPTRTSPPTRMEKDSCSPPKIIEDTAWLKSANSVRNDRTPLGDLVRLKKVKKPSVKSLTEKWQQLSDTSDRSSQSSDSRPDSLDLTSPRQSPSKESMSPTSPRSPTSCTIESENFLNSLDWPSVDNNRVSRKLSTPSYSCPGVKLREKGEGVLSRPTSLVETDRISTDLDSYLVGMNEVSSTSIAGSDSLDCCKSSASSTSSLLDMLTANLKRTAGSRHVLSVTDLRRAFERSDGRPTHGHARMSSLDSNASEDSIFYQQLTGISGGSMTSLVTGTRDHYGSITSLASSTSLISPHELQLLIEDANQSLEESGTPSHEIIVAVLHREIMGGSIGVTLAGGADYENKEISVNKVLNGSVADRDGRIKKGDRVISINGRSMKGMTHREALNILKAPRAEVVLVLSRSRSVTPLDSTPTDDGCGFQRPSYVNHISSRPPKILESPMDSKSLATELQFVDVPRGPPVSITLQKEGAGLGFSLQGGKDSPLGDRPLVAKKIFTGGAADKSGLLDVGDQILSINDTAVTQMARIEAWNFLKKQLDGPVRLNIRKKLTASSIDASASSSSPSASETSPDSSVGCRSPVNDTTADRPLQLVCIPVTEQLPGRPLSSRPVVTGVTPKAGVLPVNLITPKQV